jgi:hypothetical protein
VNRLTLFKQLFHALDTEYDKRKKELDELGGFLSDMNPYLFADSNSADPAMYSDFCDIVTAEEIDETRAKELTDKFINSCDWISKDTREHLIRDYKLF